MNDLHNYITMLHRAGMNYREETNPKNQKERYVVVKGRGNQSLESIASFVAGRMIGLDVITRKEKQMTFVVKNQRDHSIKAGATSFAPHQQLTFHSLDASVLGEAAYKDINDAMDRGDLKIISSDLTAAERKADADAFKPFKTGDPAIDGDGK